MLIMSLNINDFGGVDKHLVDHKIDGRYGNKIIDWEAWKRIDKTDSITKLKEIIKKKQPSVFISQEFEYGNSKESMQFIDWMKENSYKIVGETANHRASMTLFFVKDTFTKIPIKHPKMDLTARDAALRINDVIIYGTHIPLNSRKMNSRKRLTVQEDFWDEILEFYEEHKEEKVILIGDFNTSDKASESYKKRQQLLSKGTYDLWLHLGHSDDTPTEYKYRNRLDAVFISPSAESLIKSMVIDTDLMDKEKISDHSALYLTLK